MSLHEVPPPEVIAERQKRIYEASVKEALGSGLPDFIEDGDGTWWLPGSRAQAMAYYAGEHGCGFIEVQAKREYMRVDLQAIADLSYDLAREPDYDETYDGLAIAYTWEGEGWRWAICGKNDEGACGLWRCELRPRKATALDEDRS